MSQVVDTRFWELPKSAASRFSRLALSTTSFCCKHYTQLTYKQQEDRVKYFLRTFSGFEKESIIIIVQS